jgi:hypothetical protein
MNLSRPLLSKLCHLFLVLSFSIAGCAGNTAPKDWTQYIPVTAKPIQADIMEIGATEEFQKLALKLQEALKKHPQWSLKFVSSTPKGQPLPYHENLGLTRQEHARMQELAQGGLSIRKIGTIDITFQPLADGRMKIVTKEDSALNNLVISPEKVNTSWGDLTAVKDIHNQDPKAPTGPWKGIKWATNTMNKQTMEGQIIQFCIGKCDNKDQGIIYYDGKIFKGSTTPPTQFTHVLFFPLSKNE